jgi:nucleotidyltransferase substrate binding protein (TIGR01987 family)
MDTKKLKERFENYSKAVVKLNEILQEEEKVDYIYDATIQRFEFTYELAWKLLKEYLSYNGIADVNSPREAFKEAFASGVISNGEKWIEMLKDRNITTHTYKESQAKVVYNNVKTNYIHLFLELKERLAREIALCDLD